MLMCMMNRSNLLCILTDVDPEGAAILWCAVLILLSLTVI